jgi:hypothetical protein
MSMQAYELVQGALVRIVRISSFGNFHVPFQIRVLELTLFDDLSCDVTKADVYADKFIHKLHCFLH